MNEQEVTSLTDTQLGNRLTASYWALNGDTPLQDPVQRASEEQLKVRLLTEQNQRKTARLPLYFISAGELRGLMKKLKTALREYELSDSDRVDTQYWHDLVETELVGRPESEKS